MPVRRLGSSSNRPCRREPRHDRRSDGSAADPREKGLPARAVKRAAARGTTPGGRDGLQELADAGATIIRTGRGNWSLGQLDEQLAAERAQLIDLVTRRDGRYFYLLAARRGGATSRIGFPGLPKRLNGSPLTGGQVLVEYVQEPLPPPIGAGGQVFRSVSVANGGFRDWFGRHDVHVYRFSL